MNGPPAAALLLPDALILAGGLGLRLRPVVPNLPKPMAAVNRKPFLEILLEWLRDQGVARVVLLCHYKSDTIEAHFGNGAPWGIAIEYVREHEPLGTGGAVIHAVHRGGLTDPFLLLNGDSFIDVPLHAFLHGLCGEPAGMVLTLCSNPERYGIVTMDGDGMVSGFAEKVSTTGRPLINAGIYCFPPQWFRHPGPLPCSLEKDLIPGWLAAGRRIRGYVHDGFFVDMGTPEGYARCRRWFAKDSRP